MLAWLAGLGIISWRSVNCEHHPPVPGQLAAASGLFALLALAAEYGPAAPVAALAAWGFDLAALMNILPAPVGGPTCGGPAGKTAKQQEQASGLPPGTTGRAPVTA